MVAIIIISAWMCGILLGIAIHDKVFKKQNRNRRIKDYHKGYIQGTCNTHRTAEEYLNEEK